MYKEAGVERMGEEATVNMFGIIGENTKRKGPL